MKEYLSSVFRTHLCSELRKEQIGETVTLSGWIQKKRDHGGILFVDLRDNYGLTQVVLSGSLKDEFDALRVESVVTITGEVVARSEETINPKLDTGHVEIKVTSFDVHSACDVLPFQIAEDDQAPEASRLKYRFLELRRERLHRNIIARSKIIQGVRDIMQSMGFLEFQTPILTASSPEGARDFLVPSRLHPGKFFALPQAPQMFKQLVQVSGFDRYFQIAPCFRDEDARADRSPGEFYQIDMELSFVEQEDVFRVNENLMYELFTKFSDWKVTPKPFPQIPYKESLAKYGSDKPDLRIPLEIENVSEVFKGTEFRVFAGVLEQGGQVQALKVPVTEIPPRKYFDDAIDHFKKKTGSGLAYLIFHDEGVKGSVQKFISENEITALREKLDIKDQSIVFFAAGDPAHILPWFGKFRVDTGRHFNMVEPNSYRFCWIVDYPLYERDPKTGKIDFSHNPFGMPKGGIEAFDTDNPLEIFSAQYDMVCNGYEFGSGAIRNHRPDIMYKAFEVVGYKKEEVDKEFAGLLNAFRFGAPPHGGFAHGLDRIIMLLTQEEAIREVIMYPLAQTGEDLMMGAPSELRPQQLKDVHIQLDLPEEIEAK